MAEHIENLDAELDEAKATGEDSMAADATTPAGGTNTKRKADKSVAAEKSHKQGSSDEKTPMGTNDVGMKEGIEVLFDGEELSEAFKEKTTAIFEAAIHQRVEAVKADLEEAFDTKLEENVQVVVDELIEKVDSYLDYVVSEWVKENEVQIESNIKVEVAESLLGSVVNLVKEHNLEMSEEVVDSVKIAEQRAEEATQKYNEAVAELIEAKAQISENARSIAFGTVSEGLADTQVEKLRVLSEGLSFVDADDYTRKLSVIKESYFETKVVDAGDDLAETLLEEVDETEEALAPALDPQIAAYVNALARTTK